MTDKSGGFTLRTVWLEVVKNCGVDVEHAKLVTSPLSRVGCLAALRGTPFFFLNPLTLTLFVS